MFKRNALSLVLGTLILGAQGVSVAATFDENTYGNDRNVMARAPSTSATTATIGGPGFDENAYGRDLVMEMKARTVTTASVKSMPPGFDENAYVSIRAIH